MKLDNAVKVCKDLEKICKDAGYKFKPIKVRGATIAPGFDYAVAVVDGSAVD